MLNRYQAPNTSPPPPPPPPLFSSSYSHPNSSVPPEYTESNYSMLKNEVQNEYTSPYLLESTNVNNLSSTNRLENKSNNKKKMTCLKLFYKSQTNYFLFRLNVIKFFFSSIN